MISFLLAITTLGSCLAQTQPAKAGRRLLAEEAAGSLRVFVRTDGEDKVAVDVPSDATVDVLKAAIEAELGVAGSLSFGGHPLTNGSVPLADISVCPEAVVDRALSTRRIRFEAMPHWEAPQQVQCDVTLTETNDEFVQQLIKCAKGKVTGIAADEKLGVIIQLREGRPHTVMLFREHVVSGNFFVAIGDSAHTPIDASTRWKGKPVCDWFN